MCSVKPREVGNNDIKMVGDLNSVSRLRGLLSAQQNDHQRAPRSVQRRGLLRSLQNAKLNGLQQNRHSVRRINRHNNLHNLHNLRNGISKSPRERHHKGQPQVRLPLTKVAVNRSNWNAVTILGKGVINAASIIGIRKRAEQEGVIDLEGVGPNVRIKYLAVISFSTATINYMEWHWLDYEYPY